VRHVGSPPLKPRRHHTPRSTGSFWRSRGPTEAGDRLVGPPPSRAQSVPQVPPLPDPNDPVAALVAADNLVRILRGHHLQYANASLSVDYMAEALRRLQSLLAGMCAAEREQAYEAMPVLVRAMTDTFLVFVYAQVGGQSAAEAIYRDAYHRNTLTSSRSGVA